MCFHRRLLYTCSHHAWLDLTRPCAAEASFDRGEADTGCGVRWSHGFDTLRVQRPCPGCAARQTAHTSQLGAVRDQIRALKEQLRTIKGPEAVRGDEWLGAGEGEDSEGRGQGVVGVGNETGDGAGAGAGAGADADAVLSSSGGDEETDETLVEEEGRLDETMEEVRVDPKHWPFKLPLAVAERRREQAEVEMAAQSE